MLPRLTGLQWVLFALFLFFYGFAVFAFTRDYYLRHPPRPGVAAQVPHQVPASTSGEGDGSQAGELGQRMRQALDGQAGERGVDLDRNDPLALGNAADQLFAARRFQAAVPLYQRVLELRPEDAETLNDLGLALHYLGRGAEALERLQEGTELAPEFQRVWLSLGFVALQNNQPSVAREALEQAQTLDPGTEIADEAERLLGLMDGDQGD
ncbi:tetratricopeptide repeat protein [Halochromatium sp.]